MKTWARTPQNVERLAVKEAKTIPEIWIGALSSLFQAHSKLVKVLWRWGNSAEFDGPFMCDESFCEQRVIYRRDLRSAEKSADGQTSFKY
jgi:hypothetical protein